MGPPLNKRFIAINLDKEKKKSPTMEEEEGEGEGGGGGGEGGGGRRGISSLLEIHWFPITIRNPLSPCSGR